MRFGLLGPLLVHDGDATVAVAAPRHRVLLAALLVRAGHTVPTDRLAEIVWDGALPASAAVTLRTYVMRLRRALGPALGARILTSPPGYLIEAGEAEVDLLRFAALCRDAGAAVRARLWGQAWDLCGDALGLWRGYALADVDSQILHRDEVPRLEQQRLQAVEWRADAGLELGRHAELIPELQAAAGAYPLRERYHAQLMLALYRSHRRAEALAVYRHVRRGLVSELGVEPGVELRELHRRILAGDAELCRTAEAQGHHRSEPPVRPGVPRQLPMAVPHFAGRQAELAKLTGLLDHEQPVGTVVVTAVSGTAGVGKTALAVYWAHQVAGRFPDGQMYVNLRGFAPTHGSALSPDVAIRGFLDTLGVAPERLPVELSRQTALYRSLMAGRRMLVVLDNARDADQVRPLLPGTPGCVVVVTSRNRLASLLALEGAQAVTLDVISPEEATELLASRLGRQRVAAEPNAVAQIVARCAGLPLALAIVAARVAAHPDFPLVAAAAELAAARDSLDPWRGEDAAIDLRAVFSWSYRALSPPAARLFRLLGLHPSTDVGVAAAAGLAGVAGSRARALLVELTGAHLLTEHVPGRFQCHDLLHMYAAELVQEEEPEADRYTATDRMLDHYLHSADGAEALLDPTRPRITLAPASPGANPVAMVNAQQSLAWFVAEHRALLAALRLAANTGRDTRAWQLAWALARFLHWRGHWHDWEEAARIAVAAAERTCDPMAQAINHRGLGHVYLMTGRMAAADRHVLRALELFRLLNDHNQVALMNLNLITIRDRQGRIDDALQYAQQALVAYRADGNRVGQIRALNAVGWTEARLGRHEQALASCQDALRLVRGTGHRAEEAMVLDSLGRINLELGRYDRAVARYQQAVDLRRAIGDRHAEAASLASLGDAQLTGGDPEAARISFTQALQILTELDHPDVESLRARLAAG